MPNLEGRLPKGLTLAIIWAGGQFLMGLWMVLAYGYLLPWLEPWIDAKPLVSPPFDAAIQFLIASSVVTWICLGGSLPFLGAYTEVNGRHIWLRRRR